ncbi:MAG TPA: hypothetical protein VMV10_22405 [Pirellulales bacterium]|nr:hypothetical protein [Pirellulales bacterium]
MNGSAGVHSVAALEELKNAIAKFQTEGKEALAVTEMAVNRGLDWFQHDLLKQWQSEFRKREEAVTNARADLERCRMQSFGDRTPDCTDQKVALKKAQLRLEEAEQKIKAVKKWSRILEEEVGEYRGPAQELGNVIAGELPKAMADLNRMLTALEAYMSVQAPPGASVSMAVGSEPASVQSAAPSAAQPSGAAPASNPAASNAPPAAEQAPPGVNPPPG